MNFRNISELEKIFNTSNPIVENASTFNNLGRTQAVPKEFSTKLNLFLDMLFGSKNFDQGSSKLTVFDDKTNQGFINLIPFNDPIHQGFVHIDTETSEIFQGETNVFTWNPILEQGLATVSFNYTPNLGEMQITSFNPTIIQGSSEIAYPSTVVQGSIRVQSNNVTLNQGSINIVPWSFSGNLGSVDITSIPVPDFQLEKLPPDSLIQYASILDYIIDPGGLDYILLASAAELLPESLNPFSLKKTLTKRSYFYVSGKPVKIVDLIHNTNVEALNKFQNTDPKRGGGKQTYFGNLQYSDFFIDNIIKRQSDLDSKPESLPGRSISPDVQPIGLKDEMLAFKKDELFGYATLNYKNIINKAAQTNPTEFTDFRDSITIVPNKGINIKPAHSYSDKNTVKRLKLGDHGLPNLDRSTHLTDTNQTDQLMLSETQTGNDLVLFQIENVRDLVTLQFRSYIKGFIDDIQPKWSEVEYIGRPDSLNIYKAVTRNTSIIFMIPALTRNELKVLYKKLNLLTNMVLPDKTGLMVAPFTKITLGSYFSKIPAYITSLRYEIDDDFPWEINLDGDLGELPQYIRVNIGLKIVGNSSPTRDSNSFKISKF